MFYLLPNAIMFCLPVFTMVFAKRIFVDTMVPASWEQPLFSTIVLRRTPVQLKTIMNRCSAMWFTLTSLCCSSFRICSQRWTYAFKVIMRVWCKWWNGDARQDIHIWMIYEYLSIQELVTLIFQHTGCLIYKYSNIFWFWYTNIMAHIISIYIIFQHTVLCHTTVSCNFVTFLTSKNQLWSRLTLLAGTLS